MNRLATGVLCATLLGLQPAVAAPLPKEGTLNLLNCWAGEVPVTMPFSKENLLGTLSYTGVLWNPTAGGPFDSMTGECGGHYAVSPNGVDSVGQCQFVDSDGDKTLVSIPQNSNGVGTWKFIAGTGKYKGLTGSGDFKPMRQFPPAITQGKAAVCNTVTGTYKLP